MADNPRRGGRPNLLASDALSSQSAPLSPPADASEEFLAIWRDLLASFPASSSYFSACDRPILIDHVQVVLLLRRMTAELDATGLVTDKGRANPLISGICAVRKTLLASAAALRATPASRTRQELMKTLASPPPTAAKAKASVVPIAGVLRR